jgi:lipooligosaccharide transport system permease protein
MNPFRPPSLSLRFIPVWQRNFLVWRKLAIPSILGNLADPMIYMLGLGYGLGAAAGSRRRALHRLLAAGAVCFSTMNAATFEALYSAFSRMQVQRPGTPSSTRRSRSTTWCWPSWCGRRARPACRARPSSPWPGARPGRLAAGAVGAAADLPAGLAFAALGLIVTALAPSYDFFMYYFTLFVTPMTLLSGVFFPVEQLPAAFQAIVGRCCRCRTRCSWRGRCSSAKCRRRPGCTSPCWPAMPSPPSGWRSAWRGGGC